jgi:hypothetical protein
MCSLLDLPLGPYLWGFSVSRIALVSPERSKRIESIVIQMAQSGQLRGRVSEEQLIGLLDQASHLTVVYTRINSHRCRWRMFKGKENLRKQRSSYASLGGSCLKFILILICSINAGRALMTTSISSPWVQLPADRVSLHYR